MKVAKYKNVVTTGYNGYIGSNFLNNKHYSIVELENCFDMKLLHLACKVENSFDAFVENLNTNKSVLNYCKSNNLELIYVSSNCVYPIKENWPDYYALSKMLGEKLAGGSAILRIGDVFGKGQKHGNLFKNIEQCIKSKKGISLFGSGSKVRNYIYIKDLVSVLEYLIDNYEPRIYNICYSESWSVLQILNYLSNITGSQLSRVPMTVDESVREMRPTKIDGFDYKFTMETALTDYVNCLN